MNHTPAPSEDRHPGGFTDLDLPGIDVVPGIPPVPISVWRTPYEKGDSPAVPASLARRIVAAFSRPRDTIIDLTGGHQLTAMAAASGRVHLPGSFTPAGLLQVGEGRTTGLIAASWPLGPDMLSSHHRLAKALRLAAQRLRPAGCLVLLAESGAPTDFTTVVGACRAAGMGYLQHIVAVRADMTGDELAAHRHDQPAGESAAVHLHVHADLFVFVQGGADV